MITRRLILQALPFLVSSAAIPAAIVRPAPVEEASIQERIDHHVTELVKLFGETAGLCDGWRVAINYHPWDK